MLYRDGVPIAALESGEFFFFFFFSSRRRHTRSLRDWSSDVCSSDLAVLVARGACGNPWIFRDLAAADAGRPPPPPASRDEWVAVVLRHVDLQIEHRRRQAPGDDPVAIEGRALRELRKHLLWYTRGRRGGVRFRRDADALRTSDDVRRLVELHFPPGGDGFALEAAPAAGEREVSE